MVLLRKLRATLNMLTGFIGNAAEDQQREKALKEAQEWFQAVDKVNKEAKFQRGKNHIHFGIRKY